MIPIQKSSQAHFWFGHSVFRRIKIDALVFLLLIDSMNQNSKDHFVDNAHRPNSNRGSQDSLCQSIQYDVHQLMQ